MRLSIIFFSIITIATAFLALDKRIYDSRFENTTNLTNQASGTREPNVSSETRCMVIATIAMWTAIFLFLIVVLVRPTFFLITIRRTWARTWTTFNERRIQIFRMTQHVRETAV